MINGEKYKTTEERDEAEAYNYRKEARRYFNNLRLPAKTTTPTACGFFHRRFGVMSMRLFRKNFPEWKGGAE